MTTATDLPTFWAIPNAAEVDDLLSQPAWTPADTLARVDALIAQRRAARSAAARKGAETERRRKEARGLAEEGRVLASQRDDLIAQGVDPADLEVPLHPGDPS